MQLTQYRGRRAVQIENPTLRLTATIEGGHIAEIVHKPSGVNPLWSPPWPTIEPSAYDLKLHPEYGNDAESKLLAGILGHNLCLDVFGGPSEEEARAGSTVHGEASINSYSAEMDGDTLVMRTVLQAPQIAFERRLTLRTYEVVFAETVENLSILDRPIAWTQHVTLGAPFVEPGHTRFEVNATHSMVLEGDYEGNYLEPGAKFVWPDAPAKNGKAVNLRTYTDAPVSAAFTTHLMQEPAYFVAVHRGLSFGYRWRREDFPWLGIWEENRSRTRPPWNGNAITRGMEFGVSPFPEPRRKMIERRSLFDTPGFRWLPAKSKLTAEYEAFFEA
jgi:hypothetical protein